MCKKRNIYTMSELSLAMMSMYNKLNEYSFGGELPKVIITFEAGNKANSYGWITSKADWVQGKEERYSINISSDFLDRDITDITETLLHEMCHLYAIVKEIKDTARSGIYHNKKFAEIANAHMLKAIACEHIGYRTEATEELREWVKANAPITEIRLKKKIDIKAEKDGKPKQSTRKYVCPCCGLIIRATKECKVMCMECEEEMKLQ